MTAKPARLLLDEHIWEGLAEALVNRGHDVAHVNHTDQRGLDDAPLLEYATSLDRAILTCNARDFVPLARQWYLPGKTHAGIVLSVQLTPSELLRQTQNLLQSVSADELRNTVRWLQEFKFGES